MLDALLVTLRTASAPYSVKPTNDVTIVGNESYAAEYILKVARSGATVRRLLLTSLHAATASPFPSHVMATYCCFADLLPLTISSKITEEKSCERQQ